MDSKSLRELKAMAKSAKICNYTKMSKLDLIKALEPQCEGNICKLVVIDSAEAPIAKPIEHQKRIKKSPKYQKSGESLSDKRNEMEILLKKVTKNQLMKYASDNEIPASLKSSKEHLLDAIIENSITRICQDILKMCKEPAQEIASE
jgi:Rho termination factor, N-terminal domain